MDASRFDQLARVLALPGARRNLLQVLAILPVLGGDASLWGEAADAKGRRKRRKKRHKHGQGKHKRNRKGKKHEQCRAESQAKTCAGHCGVVKNNCRKNVDCGSCACNPSCPVCRRCNEAIGNCEADPGQRGDACGEPGQICQSDGSCACDGSSCAPCETCQGDGRCSAPCDGTGCCNARTGACVENGEPCDDGNACITGATCTNGTCGEGTPVVCDSPADCQASPGACDPANGQCSYPPKPNGSRCGDKCTQACSNGTCGPGSPVTCPPAPNACQNPSVCNPSTGACSPPTNKPLGTGCSGVACGACNGAGQCVVSCTPGQMCAGGTCLPCDVCPTCAYTSVEAAIAAAASGSTIFICPGDYWTVDVTIDKSLTLIGAGSGEDGTTLSGGGRGTEGRVFHIQIPTPQDAAVLLRDLKITNGVALVGGGMLNDEAHVTLERVIVTENFASGMGGGIANGPTATLTLNDGAIVIKNQARLEGSPGNGGGIFNVGAVTLNEGSKVAENVAGAHGGGIFNDAVGDVIGMLRLNAGSNVTGNRAELEGGGIYNKGDVPLNGGDVSANQPDQCAGPNPVPNCSG